MTNPTVANALRTIAAHARRDIRRAIFHLRHNGALLTFIVFLAASMWYAGSYMQKHPLMTATMDTRAGCDVGTQLHQSVREICSTTH